MLVSSFLAHEDLFKDSLKEFLEISSGLSIRSSASVDSSNPLHLVRKFSKVIGSFLERTVECSNLLNDGSTFAIPLAQLVYYSPISSSARSKDYVRTALKSYGIDSLDGKEVHHMKLDRSSNNPRFLAILDHDMHKKIHEIHELENKLEVLEDFEKHNFKHKNILINGVGTSFKNAVYVLKDLRLSPGETIETVFKDIKDDLTNKIYELTKDVCDVLEDSLRKNTVYMEYLKECEKRIEVRGVKRTIPCGGRREKVNPIELCLGLTRKVRIGKICIPRAKHGEDGPSRFQKVSRAPKMNSRFK